MAYMRDKLRRITIFHSQSLEPWYFGTIDWNVAGSLPNGLFPHLKIFSGYRHKDFGRPVSNVGCLVDICQGRAINRLVEPNQMSFQLGCRLRKRLPQCLQRSADDRLVDVHPNARRPLGCLIYVKKYFFLSLNNYFIFNNY